MAYCGGPLSGQLNRPPRPGGDLPDDSGLQFAHYSWRGMTLFAQWLTLTVRKKTSKARHAPSGQRRHGGMTSQPCRRGHTVAPSESGDTAGQRAADPVKASPAPTGADVSPGGAADRPQARPTGQQSRKLLYLTLPGCWGAHLRMPFFYAVAAATRRYYPRCNLRHYRSHRLRAGCTRGGDLACFRRPCPPTAATMGLAHFSYRRGCPVCGFVRTWAILAV
jgi:hypothetical protein